jgi:hypothetical protein
MTSAVAASSSVLPSLANDDGLGSLPPAEEDRLLDELQKLYDLVISGDHPQFPLPAATIDKLKAIASAQSLSNGNVGRLDSEGQANGRTPPIPSTADQTQPAGAHQSLNDPRIAATRDHAPFSQPVLTHVGLPGLLPGLSMSSQLRGNVAATASQTIPTLLHGSEPFASQSPHDIVRAERRLKRERIERDLHTRLEQQKHNSDSTEKSRGVLDVSAVLEKALVREHHVTGVKPISDGAASQASSFDENDYYSSQVESEWSSPGDKTADSATAVTAMATSRRSDNNGIASSRPNVVGMAHSNVTSQFPIASRPQTGPSVYVTKPEDLNDSESDDDEYTPPDVAAMSEGDEQFDSEMLHDADDSSEYEPGEITSESNGGTPARPGHLDGPTSPQVPVIRNHLTHIAAPQPNRVSPLAVAKGPAAGELQLINGRPEFVSAGSASQYPSASGVFPDESQGGSSKKAKSKKGKRKREPIERENEARSEKKLTKKQKRQELAKAEKLRRLGKAPASPRISSRTLQPQQTQLQHAVSQPHIKDEPTSPAQLLHNVPAATPLGSGSTRHQPVYVDLVSPRRTAEEELYHQLESPRYAPRAQLKEHGLSSPANVGPTSRVAYRPLHRDSHDLRRVASLQYAQRPISPVARYDPAEAPGSPYVREARSLSPTHDPDAYDPRQYTRAVEPLPMAPPPPRRIYVDQHGNQYYAEPAAPQPRASVAPVDRRSYIDERAPSRVSMAYAPSTPVRSQYARVEASMAPPPFPGRAASVALDRPHYVEAPASHYASSREQSERPLIREVRYVEAPPAPTYHQAPIYESHPSAVYEDHHMQVASPMDPVIRSYSVRPAATVVRSGSVAPVQYIRGAPSQAPSAQPYMFRQSMAPPPAPLSRPMSVAPGYDIPPQSRPGSVAPAAYALPEQSIYSQPQYRAASVAPGGYDPRTSYDPQQPQLQQQQIQYVDQNGQEVYPREVTSYEYRPGPSRY